MKASCVVSVSGFYAPSLLLPPPTFLAPGPGREPQQAELSRGREPMWLVVWTAGLEMPEGLRLWLINGRQWSPLQVTMRLKEEIASQSILDTLYLAESGLLPMLIGHSGPRECRPWEDVGGYHLPLPKPPFPSYMQIIQATGHHPTTPGGKSVPSGLFYTLLLWSFLSSSLTPAFGL